MVFAIRFHALYLLRDALNVDPPSDQFPPWNSLAFRKGSPWTQSNWDFAEPSIRHRGSLSCDVECIVLEADADHHEAKSRK
jgi:hypothetical protein